MANNKETILGQIILAIVNVPSEALGTLLDVVRRLATVTDLEFLKNLKHLLRGEFEIKFPPLIEWIGTTKTSTTEKFIAKEKFRMDSEEVKFYKIWGTFTDRFLTGNGKIEEPLGEKELRYGKLIKNSIGINIIEELGGKTKAETTLSEIYDLLKKQAHGEDGVLLTNGRGNDFYVKDANGYLCVAVVFWLSAGWNVDAYSFSVDNDEYIANVGTPVFSRNL